MLCIKHRERGIGFASALKPSWRFAPVLTAVCLALLCNGCTSTPLASSERDEQSKKFAPATDKASLYIYRNQLYGYLASIPITINGKMIGNTAAKTYFRVNLPSGTYIVESAIQNVSSISVDVESGKNYFIWQELKMGSVGGLECVLRQMDEDTGRSGVLQSKQIASYFTDNLAPLRTSHSTDTPNATTSIQSDTPKYSGTGSIVSVDGHILTAAHVVTAGKEIKVVTTQGVNTATILRVDEANDLAILKADGGQYPTLAISPSRKVRLGQMVATIGFPNIDIQGFSPKVTKGEISSLNGIGDDPRAWQISAPVQPGNSGGALLDENGNLIGVVVSKLGLKAAHATGDIPQNVNYAVKSTYALALLEPYLDASAPEPNQGASKPKFEDMVAKAQQSVVLILVY
jgi:S1-C subfamily serine protease